MKDTYHDLYLTPLSPIHLGTGEEYEPTNYIIDDQILYEFDSLEALRVLSPQSREEIEKITLAKASQDTLKRIQNFFYQNKDRIKSIAHRHVKVNDSLQQFYQSRIGKVAQHERGGHDVLAKLGINRAAYAKVKQENYIPGSGIKGAIRTALLDKENNGKRDESLLKERNANQKLQKAIFKGAFDTDPLRLVSISDSESVNANILSEIVFEINKKKYPVKNKQGELMASSADKGDLNAMLETIAPFQARIFRNSLQIKSIDLKHKSVPSIQFTASDIAEACNRFYKPVLEKELAILKSRGFIDNQWEAQIKKVLDSDALKNNQSFLLRVGRHSGAESMTLNGVRNIKIMQGRKERPLFQDQTTTIWLANDHQKNERDLVPFGWMLVDIAALNTSVDDLPDLAMADISTQWFEKLQQQKAAIQSDIDKERAKEIAAEQREQQLLDEAHEKELQEQQKLAALSPLEKQMYDIEANDPQNNPAIALMQAIIRNEWTDEHDISAVAKRIRSILDEKGDWMPDFNGTNKQKLKKKNRSLEILAWIKE
jgi:CRISPR-associated protein Csm5